MQCFNSGHDNVTVSQNAQHNDPESEAAKLNSDVIHCIIYSWSCPIATCQIQSAKKGLTQPNVYDMTLNVNRTRTGQ